MKKFVSVILILVLQLSIALGYTVTKKVKDVELVVSIEEKNVVEIQEKVPEIKGWKVNKGDISIVNNKFTMPASDVEIEAILEYTVSFNANGGAGSMAAQTFSYNVAKNLNANTFTKPGYRFIGWAESESGKIKYLDKESYIADDNNTLYAVWEKLIPKLAPGSTWYSQGGTTIAKTSITSITLENTYTPGTVVASWDASEGKTGTVTAYIEDDGSGNSTYKLTLVGDGSGKIIANEDSSYLFSDETYSKAFSKLTQINNLNILDTSNVTNMYRMFYNTSSLTSMDLSSYNTSNVANMSYMFAYCKASTIDVSKFDTKNVTDMSGMFYECKVTTLDVSNFDTSKVTTMSSMFMYCQSLQNVDVSKFDTSNVTTMSQMFRHCRSIRALDVSNFNTSKVTSMAGMFQCCDYYLATLDVSGFDTSKVTTMNRMFEDCYRLSNLDVSKFDTSNVTNMNCMFAGCNFVSVDVSGFDVSKVTDMDCMFSNCGRLTSLDLSNWNTSSLKYIDHMFSACIKLKKLNLTGLNTSRVTNMRGAFNSCKALTELDLSGFNTIKVTDMGNLFKDCTSLVTIDLSNFDTRNVTSMGGMFYGCTSLTSVNLSSFNTAKVTSFNYLGYSMFENCSSLKKLDLSNFNTSKAKNMTDMFTGMTALEEIKLGVNFSFIGDGSATCTLPTPSSEYIKGADGNWYNGNEVAYAPDSIPNNVADTYYGRKPGPVLATEGGVWYSQGGTTIAQSSITSINLVTSYTPEGPVVDSWDATKGKAGKITAYVEDDGSGNGTYKLTIAGDGSIDIRADVSCYHAFSHFSNLTSINGLDILNTSNVTDMSEMFIYCYKLSSLNLENFNTSNVTRMEGIVAECRALEELDLSNFDTSKVTDMMFMFYGCCSLKDVDLSSFDTSNVTDMSMMFWCCESLTSLDLSNFDTSKAKTMDIMFLDMQRLEKITLGEKFNFTGNGTATDCVLPTPDDNYIDGADGKWYNSNFEAFLPANVPNNVEETYYASINLVPTLPNRPILGTGMSPVNWDGTSWVAVKEENWDYNYKLIKEEPNTVEGNGKGKWANAMTSDGSMYVWIPRYTYKITGGYKEDTNSWNSLDNPGVGKIEVKFSDGLVDDTSENYLKHPAFSFGDDELAGIWVAKYEASRNDATESSAGEGTTVAVKPGVVAWTDITASEMYDYSYNLNRALDSHMMKNSEWGAVAYLTNAVGRIPYINNSSSNITGNSGESQDAPSATGVTHAWNTKDGVKASTTHNVYGIYDMSGGSEEYVATILEEYDPYHMIDSLEANKDTKYVDIYPAVDGLGYNSEVIGDAVYETSYGCLDMENTWDGPENGAWDNDESYGACSWAGIFYRGGSRGSTQSAGIFAFSAEAGYAYDMVSFRPVLATLPKTVGTITFNANGGEGSMPAQSIYEGIEQTIRKNTFTKANSVFNGWATTSTGSIVYKDEEVYNKTGNITLYAKWGLYGDANNDGNVDTDDVIDILRYVQGEDITINLVNADVNLDGVANEFDSNIILKYVAKQISSLPHIEKGILYRSNNEKSEHSIQWFTEGETITLKGSLEFESEGYIINGWSTTPTGGVEYKVGESYTATENIILYAVWGSCGDANDDGKVDVDDVLKAMDYIAGTTSDINLINADVNIDNVVNKYDVALIMSLTFNALEEAPYIGKVVIFEDNTAGSFSYQLYDMAETKALDVNGFEKENHVFTGWATTPTGSVVYTDGANYTATDNITLYAVWQEGYKVTFNANGGSGTMNPQTFTAGVAQNLTANAFTKTNYKFSGWATSTSGSVAYANGASYTATGNVTLYAVWTLNTYTVTFNANGGSGTMAAQTFTHGVAQNLTANTLTRSGYTFGGWATTSTGSVAYANGASYTATANATLYAKWNKCTLCNGVGYKTAECSRCDGWGYEDGWDCDDCEGEGDCPDCYGEGGDWCISCDGTTKCEECGGEAGKCSKCDGKGSWACTDTTCSYLGHALCTGGKVYCTNCDAKGKIDCWRCDSTGECEECDGTGHIPDCNTCGNSGDCQTCDGTGSRVCTKCGGAKTTTTDCSGC